MSDTNYEERLTTTGRNDVCPCGSGKKYKKCHLAEDNASRSAALQVLADEAQARAAAKAEEEGEDADTDTATVKGKPKMKKRGQNKSTSHAKDSGAKRTNIPRRSAV